MTVFRALSQEVAGLRLDPASPDSHFKLAPGLNKTASKNENRKTPEAKAARKRKGGPPL